MEPPAIIQLTSPDGTEVLHLRVLEDGLAAGQDLRHIIARDGYDLTYQTFADKPSNTWVGLDAAQSGAPVVGMSLYIPTVKDPTAWCSRKWLSAFTKPSSVAPLWSDVPVCGYGILSTEPEQPARLIGLTTITWKVTATGDIHD